MGSIPLAPSPCNPISLEITLDDLREVVLAIEWKFFPSLKEEPRLPPPQGISQVLECGLYLKQPFTPPQHKIMMAYCTSNHRLVIEIGQGSTILISGDNNLFSLLLL
jgi:hypothetical protein